MLSQLALPRNTTRLGERYLRLRPLFAVELRIQVMLPPFRAFCIMDYYVLQAPARNTFDRRFDQPLLQRQGSTAGQAFPQPGVARCLPSRPMAPS
jgi:hypothetical protein